MNFIYINKHKEHPEAKVNISLLWEFDLVKFEYQQMRDLVVERVIESGWPNDWWAILNLYEEEGVEDAIKDIP